MLSDSGLDSEGAREGSGSLSPELSGGGSSWLKESADSCAALPWKEHFSQTGSQAAPGCREEAWNAPGAHVRCCADRGGRHTTVQQTWDDGGLARQVGWILSPSCLPARKPRGQRRGGCLKPLPDSCAPCRGMPWTGFPSPVGRSPSRVRCFMYRLHPAVAG